ncbi:hypothetical protein CAEBREN_11842 [Caenorhabditis brenneri]|uniref:F-box domain-containing protein n=1 Tax=Caenorhabditis brenneri TaxID=135651 RepID=G0MTH1_CAEBE|nr:hypothetical protein CAEBREN_11842 [Caenorhabditis brenneri]
MTIKLLRFPSLALFKILESMPSTDKVLISFCSSKMKRLMRMVKWYVSKMQYVSNRFQTHIFLGSPIFDYGGLFVIQEVNEFTENSRTYREEEFGLQYGLSADTIEGKTATVVQVLKREQSSSKWVFHDLIIDLFRNPPVIEYEVDSDCDLSNIYINETVRNMRLSGGDANASYAERYFSTAMDLHGAVVTPLIRPQLLIDSKLTTAKYLYLEHAFYNTWTLALHFNGHRAVFNYSIFDEQIVAGIINKWKCNEGFQNLQTLEIYSSHIIPDFHINEIGNHFGARPFDGLRRPENFKEEHWVMDVHFKPMECANFLDIVRESDGKVASFLLTTSMFKFCVWN